MGEIMSQREGRSNAYDPRTGQAVPMGTKLFSQGWNTSGVGPGSRGYNGSWRPGGYNFGEGTRRPSARTSDEFYAQRDETSGNPLDNLELGNSNLMGSFLKNAIAEARGQQNGTGQAQGQASNPWADRTTFGPNATGMPGGDLQSPDDQQADLQQLIAEARAQEAADVQEQGALRQQSMQPRTGTGTTTPGATIEGMPADLYFQYKAQQSGDTNQFAQPFAAPGNDAGNPDAWKYSHRLAPFLKRLGIGQPFPSRAPL